jgi:GNAT superfamily N-acetyltransferase
VDIRQINPSRDVAEVETIVSIYKRAFGSVPWNEGFRCPVCKTTFPLSHHTESCTECEKQSCQILLAEYWPISTIIADFYREMAKPEPVCITAEDDGETLGFAWGYRVTASTDLSEKLEAPDLHTRIEGDFSYLDECAVEPIYQGRGAGKALVRGFVSTQSRDRILLRTLLHSRMHSLITHMGGTDVVRISRDRVIMTLPV